MAISKDLFLAILTMDSCHRHYGAANSVPGSAVGDANILRRDALGVSDEQYQDWQNTGFYAITYNWNGQTVISDRGTDDLIGDFAQAFLSGDIVNGYGVGAPRRSSTVPKSREAV